MHSKRSRVPSESNRNDAGYYLIEVLVTAAILLMALLSVLPMYTHAARQNAMAKDITVASSLARGQVEEFNTAPCTEIRRGTCCDGSADPELEDGACGVEQLKAGGITYTRECVIRQRVDSGHYPDDSDDTLHSWPLGGMAWLEVTVRPVRGSHLGTRRVKPAVLTSLRVCVP